MTEPTARSHRRAAVVTGAGSGLGAAFAVELAALGFDVGVCDLRPPEETVRAILSAGRRAHGAVADVSSAGDVSAFAAAVREQLGPVGVLVNNVGISPHTPFDEISLEEWRHVLAVNLDSLFLVSSAFLADMKEATWGRIVNVTSALAWDAQGRDVVHYATSKMGVLGFTRALAAEVGEHGITVNAICPGIVRTSALEDRFPPHRWDSYLERQPVKRIAEPDDLRAALALFVSEGSALITGANLPVHGGRVWL